MQWITTCALGMYSMQTHCTTLRTHTLSERGIGCSPESVTCENFLMRWHNEESPQTLTLRDTQDRMPREEVGVSGVFHKNPERVVREKLPSLRRWRAGSFNELKRYQIWSIFFTSGPAPAL